MKESIQRREEHPKRDFWDIFGVRPINLGNNMRNNTYTEGKASSHRNKRP
jgi:hypothetical protein